MQTTDKQRDIQGGVNASTQIGKSSYLANNSLSRPQAAA